MSEFAAGNKAFGFCDRCNFRYDLNELKSEVVDMRPTGFLVCEECKDEAQPQLQLGRNKITDPQALRNPRPDTSEDQRRRTSAWNPIGGWDNIYGPSFLENMYMTSYLGKLTVEITEE